MVTVGVYVNQMPMMSLKDNKFQWDFYIWFRWRGKLDKPPFETFELVNGKIDSKQLITNQLKDGEHYACVRIQATMTKFWDVRRFPFDNHAPEIVIEDGLHEVEELAYVADTINSQYNPDLKAPGWVVTGGEALYADMGHFGRKPIQTAWLWLVFPSLLLNYFGQGALLLRDPSAAANPFFLLAPKALLIPLLIISTLAAIVASQALISGAFSITRQGIQLGFIPRLEILHTSTTEEGQIYIPEVNYFIAVGCLLVVLVFQNTSNLGAAYGIAVTGTMFITTILFDVVARLRFRWKSWQATSLTTAFLIVDVAFLSANLVKLQHGGWVPLVLGLVLFMLMLTWKRGRALLNARLAEGALPISLFLDGVEKSSVYRVPGTAVFMTGNDDGVPPVLLHHLKHNKVLHERVLLVSVKTAEVPETSAAERVRVMPLGRGFWRVVASYGFMQTPNVPNVLEVVDQMGIRCKPMETSYFLGRERLIPVAGRPSDTIALSRWRKVIFSVMARNARSATEFFCIPPNRVVELGTQIEF
jgi:KUP system potassium uptake protein